MIAAVTKNRFVVGGMLKEFAVLLALLHCTLLAVAAVPWRSRGPITGFVVRTTGIVAEKYVAAFGMTQQWYFFTRPPYAPEERFALAGLDARSVRRELRSLDATEAAKLIDDRDRSELARLCDAYPHAVQLAVLSRQFHIFDDPSFQATADRPSANWYEQVKATSDCSVNPS